MNVVQKRLGLMAIVLVALIGLAKVTGDKRLETSKGGGFATLIDPSIDLGTVDVLRGWMGSKPDSAVELKRSGEKWLVGTAWDWPAKETQVKGLLDELAGLNGEQRPSNDEVLADFQLDDEKGFHLVGAKSGGSEVFHLVVGKNARGGDFVRKSGSKDVYLTTKAIRSKFGLWGDDPKPPQGRRWVELNLFKVERGDIDKVVLRGETGELTLERVFAPMPPPAAPDSSIDMGGTPPVDRANYTYRADAKGEIDKAKGDQVVGAVASLYAAEILDPSRSAADLGLAPPKRVAEVTMKDGTTTRILFGNPATDENRFYFQLEGGKPAEINKAAVERIFPDRKSLSPGAA
jgi:hypothetical protein